MPFGSEGNIRFNATALVFEGIGTFFLTLIGLSLYAVADATIIGAGFGFAFAVLAMTFACYLYSGALFNTGITTAKLLTWIPGIHERDYFGEPSLWSDFLFWALYVGVQMGAAVLAVLSLRFVDHTGTLAAALNSHPNGNLNAEAGGAFFLAWLLNTFVCLVHLYVTGPRMSLSLKMSIGPLVIASALGSAVVVSIYFGTGTLLNFAIDLAVARTIKSQGTSALWISAVAQVVGALTAALIYWLMSNADRLREAAAKSGSKDGQHSRVSLASAVLNRVNISRADPLLAMFRPAEHLAEGAVELAEDTASGAVDTATRALRF
jgi:hypothetical protein